MRRVRVPRRLTSARGLVGHLGDVAAGSRYPVHLRRVAASAAFEREGRTVRRPGGPGVVTGTIGDPGQPRTVHADHEDIVACAVAAGAGVERDAGAVRGDGRVLLGEGVGCEPAHRPVATAQVHLAGGRVTPAHPGHRVPPGRRLLVIMVRADREERRRHGPRALNTNHAETAVLGTGVRDAFLGDRRRVRYGRNLQRAIRGGCGRGQAGDEERDRRHCGRHGGHSGLASQPDLDRHAAGWGRLCGTMSASVPKRRPAGHARARSCWILGVPGRRISGRTGTAPGMSGCPFGQPDRSAVRAGRGAARTLPRACGYAVATGW